MLRFIAMVLAVTVAGAALAQQTAPHPRSKKAAPAAQAAEDPNDVSNVPRNVQKWIGGAVDDILTGTGKALGQEGDRR